MNIDKEKYRQKVEEATENRFGFYREKTSEELQKKKEQISEDINDMLHDLKNKTIKGDHRKDIYNDLEFAREELLFIEKVLEERNIKRSIHK